MEKRYYIWTSESYDKDEVLRRNIVGEGVFSFGVVTNSESKEYLGGIEELSKYTDFKKKKDHSPLEFSKVCNKSEIDEQIEQNGFGIIKGRISTTERST